MSCHLNEGKVTKNLELFAQHNNWVGKKCDLMQASGEFNDD